MRVLMILLPLLAAPAPLKLAYRHEVGVTLRDESKTMTKLVLFIDPAPDDGAAATAAERRKVVYHNEIERVVERTVLEVDDAGAPVRERIAVRKFVNRVIASPTSEPSEKPAASHGKTFVRKDGRLYDESGDVTAKYPTLVESLAGWRSARLPDEPVEPGATWEVSAAEFLKAVGKPVPDEVEGLAGFRLESVEDGVARIAFTFELKETKQGREVVGTQTAVWLFDVAAGRDRSLEMTGTIAVDGGKGGSGEVSKKRTVTRLGS